MSDNDNIGNLYSGNEGDDSISYGPGVTKIVGGSTRSNKKISMNTHPELVILVIIVI
jgi:hypothetical protein